MEENDKYISSNELFLFITISSSFVRLQ